MASDRIQPVGGWGRFTLTALGPTGLAAIGHGSIAPLVALSALDLGASIGLSALVTGLAAVGQLLGDLPASWIATRLGEKKAIIVACLWDAACLTWAFQADSLAALALAVFCTGPAGSVFGLARQSYITEAVPITFRARALSGLGGMFRIGGFIGPLAGSAIVSWHDLSWAYAFAAGMSLLAGGVTLLLPDLPKPTTPTNDPGRPRLWPVLYNHRTVLARLGSGILLLALIRSARQAILPLWCESLHWTAAAISLVFALSMAIDMSLFFLGGWIMDRFGRAWVAAPSLMILGLGLALLPLAHQPMTVSLVAVVLGLGNGIGAGVVMVLGSDVSPAIGRTQFLSGWRLMGDLGNMAGPVSIGAIVALASLSVSALVLAVAAGLGALWLNHGIRRHGIQKPGNDQP